MMIELEKAENSDDTLKLIEELILTKEHRPRHEYLYAVEQLKEKIDELRSKIKLKLLLNDS